LNPIYAKRANRTSNAKPTVLPCNFRSAGRLSNESARTLTTLHEVVARYLTNSLDVYLGTGLEVRLSMLEQLAMEEFKTKCMAGGYMLPCTTRAAGSSVLIEMDNSLMFTVIDLLLGGTGEKVEAVREVTEIDEDIMEGVGSLIAQEIERAWQPVGYSLTPGKCVKPSFAHRLFPQTEKVLRIKFDVNVAGMTGALFVSFPASLAGSLVRSTRADHAGGKGGSSFGQVPNLRKRMLECKFSLSGELPDLRVPVRHLAAIKEGSVLMLSTPVSGPAKLMLEGKTYFNAVPVREGNNKAMQLVQRLQQRQGDSEINEGESYAGS
jgi:flagellar motor switch protein FliM